MIIHLRLFLVIFPHVGGIQYILLREVSILFVSWWSIKQQIKSYDICTCVCM